MSGVRFSSSWPPSMMARCFARFWLCARTRDPLFFTFGRDDLDALLAAPSRASSPCFLQSHQKSERRIFELQMAENAPVFPDIALQKLHYVAEGDDAAGRDLGAGW